MLTTEAHIETGRPQPVPRPALRHVGNIYGRTGTCRTGGIATLAGETRARSRPPLHVEWSETHGTVTFGEGKITMQANPGALTLRAEAADEETLRRIQDLITGLLNGSADVTT